MRLDQLEQMKIAMKRAGLTQDTLSTRIGINRSTLGNYFSGERTMPPDVQERAWAEIKHAASAREAEIQRAADEQKRFLREAVPA